MGGKNHKGVTMYEEEIDRYIEKEIQAGVTIRPFDAIPFKVVVVVSPLSTRPKKDSQQRRVIMDCSWPLGASLNDGINKDVYLGRTD